MSVEKVDTLFGEIDKFCAPSDKLQELGVLVEENNAVVVIPRIRKINSQGLYGYFKETANHVYLVKQLNAGGFEISGEGLDNLEVKSISKVQKIIDAMAQELEYSKNERLTQEERDVQRAQLLKAGK